MAKKKFNTYPTVVILAGDYTVLHAVGRDAKMFIKGERTSGYTIPKGALVAPETQCDTIVVLSSSGSITSCFGKQEFKVGSTPKPKALTAMAKGKVAIIQA